VKQPVIIKGSSSGITVILDKDMPFEELLKQVAVKFKESANFFKNARLALAFEGRRLYGDEEAQILDVITDNSSIEIACVIDTDKEREEFFRQMIKEEEEHMAASVGQFYKGTLRSGQLLESEGNITILGDVNPGAKIIAKGNIIVLGALKGTAYAGSAGNDKAFVVALQMHPMQIRIGDYLARSSDKPSKAKIQEPKIAFVDDGKVYLEDLSRDTINDISLM